MENEVKAIIFDMDMTLINTFKYVQDVATRIAREDFPQIDPESIPSRVRELWGVPGEQFYTQLYGVEPDQVDPIYRKIKSLAHEYTTDVFEGVIEEVEKLSKDFSLGILTSASSAFTAKGLERRGYDLEKFQIILSSDQTRFNKPDPRAFDEVIAFFREGEGIATSQIMYVGDSLTDGSSATEAGLKFVGVETGFVKREQFKERGFSSIESVAYLSEYLEDRFTG